MKIINFIIKVLFWALIVKPIIFVFIGLNVRDKNRIPKKGPCILVANHNSHLDTLTLMSMLPTRLIFSARPVAAADYFLANRFKAWFSLNILGIIPINRQNAPDKNALFIPINNALAREEIVILYPEGSRGEPEQMQSLKKGVSYLCEQNPNIPVVPIFFHGLGKSLPKGEGLLVPFFCDVFIGPPLIWDGSRESFMIKLKESFTSLAQQARMPGWL